MTCVKGVVCVKGVTCVKGVVCVKGVKEPLAVFHKPYSPHGKIDAILNRAVSTTGNITWRETLFGLSLHSLLPL